MEGESDEVNRQRTMVTNSDEEYISLRTVPVVLKNGEKSVVVNALLDDGSTQTYLNSDVAAELGLEGKICDTQVNVLNGCVESFQTMPESVTLMSLSGQVNMKVDAFTVTSVTGNMKSVNWVKNKQGWKHLKGIKFAVPSKRVIVDMLIGIDYPDIHYSIKDVKGEPGEPTARLTPLGWTCIGKSVDDKGSVWHQNHYTQTYFCQTNGELEKIDFNLKKFGEVEGVPTIKEKLMKREEKVALDMVERSLSYKNGRYEVGIPWKEDPSQLPDNMAVARKRLHHTERQLLKNPTVKEAYKDTLQQYEEKGYITEVPMESADRGSWFLPHFPVIRMDKETTKTRIVFDAAAKSEGSSLNDVVHSGPKLQQDLFDVLLRFRKNQIAIICDIAEMHLHIEFKKEDRKYLRFFWRDIELDQPIRCYEFNRWCLA